MRHDRWPNRRVFLGWTADNRAVIHVVSCGRYDGSGAPFCSSSLEVFGATKRSGRDWRDQLTPLLDPTCRQCDVDRADAESPGPTWVVSTELASQAIHAERAALEALGTLQPSAVGTLPAVKIGGDACRIDVLVGQRRITGVIRMLAVTLTVEPRSFEWDDPVDITMVVDAN